jgi:ribosomal protein S18 acetylase RimI-like enzyme
MKDLSSINDLVNSNLKHVVDEKQGFVYSPYDNENINRTWCLWYGDLLVAVAIVADFSELEVKKYTIKQDKLSYVTAKYVSTLCVTKELRDKGIGKKMYEHLFEKFSGSDRFYVKVDIENKKSLRFHKDWKEVGNYQNMKKEKFLLLEKNNPHFMKVLN